jgi:hypothetical protein
VDVQFVELRSPIKPAEHMAELGSLLPDRYAPLQASGGGLQGVYLTLLPNEFATKLADLAGREARSIIDMRRLADTADTSVAVGLAEWEAHQMEEVIADRSIPETTRKAVVLARRGQGLFKQNVQRLESKCRVTGVEKIEHLRASHCKPWRDANNEERLDGENGLLLTPDVDHLFDRGFISFEDNGTLLVSPVTHRESLHLMGLDESLLRRNVGSFSEGQRSYLAFHRDSVFLQSRVRR